MLQKYEGEGIYIKQTINECKLIPHRGFTLNFEWIKYDKIKVNIVSTQFEGSKSGFQKAIIFQLKRDSKAVSEMAEQEHLALPTLDKVKFKIRVPKFEKLIIFKVDDSTFTAINRNLDGGGG